MAGRKRQAAKLLRAAANILETKGWYQGSFGNEEKGFCLLGSINVVDTGEATWSTSPDANLAKEAIRVVSGQRFLSRWNDSPGRTKSEVVSAMRKAARALEHGLKV
jgi:hypothetical protein